MVRLQFATQVFGGPCEQTANMRKNTDTHTEQRTIIQLYQRASGRIKRSIKTQVPDRVKRMPNTTTTKSDPMLENEQALPRPSASAASPSNIRTMVHAGMVEAKPKLIIVNVLIIEKTYRRYNHGLTFESSRAAKPPSIQD